MIYQVKDSPPDNTLGWTENRKTPRLESGDRLSRPEFERRYAGIPENKKAELIEGVVYLASPLRFESHEERNPTLSKYYSQVKTLVFTTNH